MRSATHVPHFVTQPQELTSDELDRVNGGGAGTPLASVTDLVIDPFNPNRATYNPDRSEFFVRQH